MNPYQQLQTPPPQWRDPSTWLSQQHHLRRATAPGAITAQASQQHFGGPAPTGNPAARRSGLANTIPTASATARPPQQSRILSLSEQISQQTVILDNLLTQQGLRKPSFVGLPPVDYNAAMEDARTKIEAATLELNELVKAPRALVVDPPPAKHAAVAFLAKFEVARRVPVSGDCSYQTLAEECGVDFGALEALLGLAISYRIFRETSNGRVAHSPASLLLREDWMIRAGKAFADDFFPMTAGIAKALEKFPLANCPAQAAAAIVNGVEGRQSFYQFLETVPDRSRSENFNCTMAMAQHLPGFSWDYVVSGFDWASIPDGSLCVDLGGGHGQAAHTVADKFPKLLWLVQDIASSLVNHPPADSSGKLLTYMEHDFFQPQPRITCPTKVFFVRRILHDWPEKQCHMILQNLIPSLREGSRILIMEQIMKRLGQPGLENLRERAMRARDVGQLALGNGRERTRDGWRRLINGADPEMRRFQVVQFIEQKGSDLGVVEVVWKPEGTVRNRAVAIR